METPVTRGPLSHLRVLELGQDVATAYCGRQFATWGADVVVVEPTAGSPLRRLAPFAPGRDGTPVSLLWTNVSANKRSVRLDDGADVVALIERADVLLLQGGPDALVAHGTSLSALRAECPSLVVVSITPFGLSGPYANFRATGLTVEALSGYLGLNGEAGMPPIQAPGRLTEYAVGVNAFVAALAAVLKRERTGWGEFVEVSAMETLATMIPFLHVQYLGGDKRREGGTSAGVRLLACADGWISMMVVSPRLREVLCQVLEIPEGEFPDELYAGDYADVLRKALPFLERYTRRWKTEDLFLALSVSGITCGKVMSLGEVLELDQLKARDYWRTLDHPELGSVRMPGPAGRFRSIAPVTPCAARDAAGSPAKLGWDARTAPAADPERAGEMPLEGMRVLDLTQAWIGPYTTLLLADLGADVIKIESHKRPDVWRMNAALPPAIPGLVHVARPNRSHYFNSVNYGKRNLTLNLRSEEGRALFLRLATNADLVVENYTSQVMANFGLAYETLREVKPDLVMTSCSGYGRSGPWEIFATNGSAIEAMAGWDWLHRHPGGPPVQMGFYQADPIDGLQMAALTLIGLIHRTRTGEGDHLDGAMLDASVGYLGELLLQAQLRCEPEPTGNRSAAISPHGVFPCAGEDRWIALAADGEAAWRALAATADLDDPRFASLSGRKAHEDDLEARLAAWTRRWDADALMSHLQHAGVPAGVVRGVREGLDEPQLSARGWFRRLTHHDLGTHSYNGYAWRFPGCGLKAASAPPRLGEHSDELLRDLLGLSPAEIAELKAKDVTGQVF
jgi:crotonobetainyl-CoA:carnitine CoA-transferase CaiB-like acyl-CoA transferase